MTLSAVRLESASRRRVLRILLHCHAIYACDALILYKHVAELAQQNYPRGANKAFQRKPEQVNKEKSVKTGHRTHSCLSQQASIGWKWVALFEKYTHLLAESFKPAPVLSSLLMRYVPRLQAQLRLPNKKPSHSLPGGLFVEYAHFTIPISLYSTCDAFLYIQERGGLSTSKTRLGAHIRQERARGARQLGGLLRVTDTKGGGGGIFEHAGSSFHFAIQPPPPWVSTRKQA